METQINTKTEITKDEIVSTARKMHDAGLPLLMIHGYRENDGSAVVSYEFGTGSELSIFEVRGEETLPSIEDIYDLAAQWPERQIHEFMNVNFEGLDTSKRLMLPENLISGEGQILVTPLADLRKANVDERADGKK